VHFVGLYYININNLSS